MAIQARRGLETDFNPEKMLPGELAVTTDTRKIYATFAPGDCKRMATYEDMVDDIEEANEEIIRNMTTVVSEATTNAQNATAAAETATTNATAAAEAAEQAAQSVTATIATSTQAGAVKPTNDFLIGEAGALKLNTEFTVPEGLSNLVSGSDWNVILGQLAKLVEGYIDDKLTGFSTAGDVVAKSADNPISMAGLKESVTSISDRSEIQVLSDTYGVYYAKRAGIVNVWINCESAVTSLTNVGDLPVGYRPPRTTVFCSYNAKTYAYITSEGKVVIVPIDAGGPCLCTLTYISN